MKHTHIRINGYYALIVLIFLLSLFIRAAFPIFAVGGAGYDDMLFVKLAAEIGGGHWLGDYNNLTHAKGVAYPVFLLLNHFSGLPLKLTEHILYLFAAMYFSTVVARVGANKWIALSTFILLAFIPTAWTHGVGGRVVREGLYVSLTLFLLALAIRCWVEQKNATLKEEIDQKRPLLFTLGITGGIYWLTREEGAWLFPPLAILLGYWLIAHRSMLRSYRQLLYFMALPVISASLLIGIVNTHNYQKYRVFRNNDFHSADFQAGYGALSRIRHDHWQRYVVFPKDARERAYRFSAAARELKPYFEGEIGTTWRDIGCKHLHIESCPEILSGWFMWALRDAVAAAGHYRNAKAAKAFYLRLAREIDEACKQHAGECLPRRDTMVPPWRDHYWADTLAASKEVFTTLLTLDGAPVGVVPSLGSPEQLAFVTWMTNGPVAVSGYSVDEMCLNPPNQDCFKLVNRINIARFLATAEAGISQYGIPVALFLWGVWVAVAIWKRRASAMLAIASALVAAVASRVVLLGLLEATSIPSNNMLYLSPVVPLAMALIPAVVFGFFGFLGKK